MEIQSADITQIIVAVITTIAVVYAALRRKQHKGPTPTPKLRKWT